MVSQRCRRNVFLEALLSTGRPSLLGAMSNSSGGASNASNALNATLGQIFCVGNQTVNCTMANASAPPAAPPEDIDGDGASDIGPTLLFMVTIAAGSVFFCSVLCVMRGTGSMPRAARKVCCVVDG